MDQGHLEIKPDFGFLQHSQIPFESNVFTVLVLIDIGIVKYAPSCTGKKELMEFRFEIVVDLLYAVKDRHLGQLGQSLATVAMVSPVEYYLVIFNLKLIFHN